MLVTAAAGHHTACSRVGRNGDGVADGVEVRHKGAVRHNGERVGRIGGDLHPALRPVDKRETLVGRSRQRDRGAVAVAARTGQRTARRRISGGGDDIVDREGHRHHRVAFADTLQGGSLRAMGGEHLAIPS